MACPLCSGNHELSQCPRWKVPLIAAALFASGTAFADDFVLKAGADTLRLQDAPCAYESVLSQLNEQWRGKFKRANAVVRGKQYEACWIADASGVFVAFDDGDEARFPFAVFKRESGI